MQILPPKHHHILWGFLCTGIIFHWVHPFRNAAFKALLTHTFGMHPAVLVWLFLVLELRHMMAVCLKVVIVYFTCGLCSRDPFHGSFTMRGLTGMPPDIKMH